VILIVGAAIGSTLLVTFQVLGGEVVGISRLLQALGQQIRETAAPNVTIDRKPEQALLNEIWSELQALRQQIRENPPQVIAPTESETERRERSRADSEREWKFMIAAFMADTPEAEALRADHRAARVQDGAAAKDAALRGKRRYEAMRRAAGLPHDHTISADFGGDGADGGEAGS
jgi:hypothetical protein